MEKGRALLTRQIVQPDQVEPICEVKEWDVTKEDEEDEDDVLFAILESWFGNEETVRNWQTIKLPCLQYKNIGKATFTLASLTWFNHIRTVAVVRKSHTHAANIRLQSNACTSYFKQYFTFLLGGDNLNNFFQECTVTNPAIWLVICALQIFLYLTTVTVMVGNSAGEIGVVVNFNEWTSGNRQPLPFLHSHR